MGVYFDSYLTDLLLVIAIILLYAYLFFKHSFSHWEHKGLATITPSIPFGNVKNMVFQRYSFGVQTMKLYQQFKERGEKYGGFYILSIPGFMPVDPELVKSILTSSFPNFSSRGLNFNEDYEPLGANLFVLSGHRWKNLRSKVSPTFTSGKLKGMFSTLLAVGEQLTQAMREITDSAEAVEIKGTLAKFTTDVIGSCVFGIECNSFKNPNAEFRKYGQMFVETAAGSNIRPFMNQVLPFLMRLTRTPFIKTDISNFFIGVLKDTIEFREKNNISRADFMNMFIKLKNREFVDDDAPEDRQSEIEALTFNELAAQALLFFLAGFEASSTGMSFCLYELAYNPDVQDKLRLDIVQSLAKTGGDFTYEGLMQMEYLDKVISEVLRKYPSAPSLIRKCTQDFTIPSTSTVIEAGTQVWISVLGMHRDPEYYPNPDLFDPERFSEKQRMKRPPYTYLPFGDGPRHCVGMRFATLQMKLGIALLIRNFKFSVDQRTETPIELANSGVLLMPKHKIWLLPNQVVD